jgi:hypothetical protein
VGRVRPRVRRNAGRHGLRLRVCDGAALEWGLIVKSQAPNPKSQRTPNLQIPNQFPNQLPTGWDFGLGIGLGFGGWESVGAWDLELGI